MNDEELTTAVRQSVHGVTMDVPEERITRRSRAIRTSGHRKLATGITAVAAAGASVLGLGLAGTFNSTPASGASSAGTIRTDAFTLVKHANGTATLTLNYRVLLEPGTLQRDLQKDGIHAVVTSGKFCTSDPTPAGFSQVVTTQDALTFTINPKAIPSGAELTFGNFKTGGTVTTDATLASTGSLSCQSTPPHGFLKAGGLELALSHSAGYNRREAPGKS